MGHDAAPRALPTLAIRPLEGWGAEHRPLQKRPIVGAVLRRGMPRVLEASIVPNVLFLVVFGLLNAVAAIIAVFVWTLSAFAVRVRRRQGVPGVLILALTGLLARTALALATGSAVLYFVQPVITTVAIAVLLAVSVVVGRPFVERLAGDFCPLEPEVNALPSVGRLFHRLTLVWIGVYVATATLTLVLLVTTSLGVFVAVKTVGCLAITALGVTATVWMSWVTARRENLAFRTVLG